MSRLLSRLLCAFVLPGVLMLSACGGGGGDEGDVTASVAESEALLTDAAAEEARRAQSAMALPPDVEARMEAEIAAEDEHIRVLTASMTPEALQAAQAAAAAALSESGLQDSSPAEVVRRMDLVANSAGGCTHRLAKYVPPTQNFARLQQAVARSGGSLAAALYSPSYTGPRLNISGSITVDATRRIVYAWHHLPVTCASLSLQSNAGLSVWASAAFAVAAASAVMLVGNVAAFYITPTAWPYVAPCVGCLAGAVGSAAYSVARQLSTVKEAAQDAAIKCVQGAVFVAWGRYTTSIAGTARDAVAAGETLSNVGWLASLERQVAVPILTTLRARLAQLFGSAT